MKFSKSAGITAMAGLAVLGCGVVAYASDAGAQKQPAVTMAQARAVALKAFPGTIDEADLERERGGSGLRYSFDMHSPYDDRRV
ncbi:MAG: PepSY domain-containing protein [Gammaproteobacteria bacterium]